MPELKAEGPKSPNVADTVRVAPELHYEIEQFLYHEARLLDERSFEQWYELLADDLEYVMPTRYNRLRREARYEFAAPDETQLFDEDKHSIAQRIRRLRSGTAWAEDPPSRTRHFVSNVTARPSARPDEFEVDCYYLLYRSRLEREVEIFAGMRHDLLRRSDGVPRWRIARRRIILDQTVVLARNLSFFF
ncbi:MAG TPA: 3-phenylpropionate/cinnamic acid dioxygenase subunit beta [Candidatus Binataceae bacterium]|nr:3-phenylpropionate/cinnamic acid dioxygenase subunit beta [Candidatus Binataceae bacterium]